MVENAILEIVASLFEKKYNAILFTLLVSLSMYLVFCYIISSIIH